MGRPSAFLRFFDIELNDFCLLFLTILKEVCFIIKLIYESAYFNPIWIILVKLHWSNRWKSWNCFFTKLIGIDTLWVHVEMPVAVSNILCLLIKVWDAFRADWIACVTIPSMQVVTWGQCYFYPQVTVVLKFSKDCNRFIWIKINTKQASIWVVHKAL